MLGKIWKAVSEVPCTPGHTHSQTHTHTRKHAHTPTFIPKHTRNTAAHTCTRKHHHKHDHTSSPSPSLTHTMHPHPFIITPTHRSPPAQPRGHTHKQEHTHTPITNASQVLRFSYDSPIVLACCLNVPCPSFCHCVTLAKVLQHPSYLLLRHPPPLSRCQRLRLHGAPYLVGMSVESLQLAYGQGRATSGITFVWMFVEGLRQEGGAGRDIAILSILI